MSHSQALLSATTVPANWMQEKSGQIKVGYSADLLILNKNPLEDIRNSKEIDTVIIDGRVLNRQKLDAMLKAVKDANDKSRTIDIGSLGH